MTGYGKAATTRQEKKIVAEARSLNSKQLDLSIRVPSVFKEKELELRGDAAKVLERGKADLSIYIEFIGEANTISLNRPLAMNYYKVFKSFSDEINEKNNLLPVILKMPEVMKNDRQELDEEEWLQVRTTALTALENLDKFREDEGKVLQDELQSRINTITQLLNEVSVLDNNRMPALREKINKNITEFLSEDKIDRNRFEQEMIYYMEKLDISEEKLRLKTHCEYFLSTMDENSSGRKLGFISQEIGREINTIGSKCNDAKMQKCVVQMKDELEKIKEQLLNVL